MQWIRVQKNSVRFVLSYLSHVHGLRTCHLVKISNFEAHADMNITSPLGANQPAICNQGDAYKHIPRTSTVAPSVTRIPSVRSSERKDEALSKRLFMSCIDSITRPVPAFRKARRGLPCLALCTDSQRKTAKHDCKNHIQK